MKRVYIAGSFSADNVLDVLKNIRIGIRAGTEALLKGYAPFVPWLDNQMSLTLKEDEKITVDEFYKYGLAFLEVCEEIWVLPNSEKSVGTQEEIKLAKKLGLKIKYLGESNDR